ncbi:hypothetical protein VTI74DRAFT_10403 [Chaetomium olivicolor]
MRYGLNFFVVALLGLGSAQSAESERKIAIIGAGPAGSSAAYHLKNFASHAGVHINITLFEKTDRIGGRSLTVNAFNDPTQRVELGASIFVQVNHILFASFAEFGLSPRTPGSDTEPVMGIWNGDRFVFTVDQRLPDWWNKLKVILKYGFMAPKRTEDLTGATISKFLQIYNAPFFPFTSLTQRVNELALDAATSTTGEKFLEANKIGNDFAGEVIQAAVRANYVANLADIHGLDALVSLSTEGAMSVQGGNWQIFHEMAHRSGARILLNTTAVAVEKSQGKYTVKTSSGSTPGNPTAYPVEFDNVIIANPLQLSGMSVAEGVLQKHIETVNYANLHVTLFTSPRRFNPQFFGLPASQQAPGVILTTLAETDYANSEIDSVGKAGFFSLMSQGQAINPQTGKKEYIYKIFSPEAVTPEFLSRLLGGAVPATFTGGNSPISWYHSHVFNALPKAVPRTSFQDHVVGQGVYYTSAIEPFISTMETSALMGKNVARLIIDDMMGTSSGGPVKVSEEQSVLGT